MTFLVSYGRPAVRQYQAMRLNSQVAPQEQLTGNA